MFFLSSVFGHNTHNFILVHPAVAHSEKKLEKQRETVNPQLVPDNARVRGQTTGL